MIKHPEPARRPYLGYREHDRSTPFAEFFDPDMAPLPRHVVEALEHGPQAEPTLLAFANAGSLTDDGRHQTENGYGVFADGSIHVSVLTDMPGVTPAMWDWWFGWHGSESQRYKLWHPRAHLYAQWGDRSDRERRGRDRYVGRTSFVDEYLGSTFVQGAIRFVDPSTLGLDNDRLADAEQATAICARIGSADRPVDAGYLVHHVRATANGCEMRSRFWLGGPHIALRSGPAALTPAIRPLAQRMIGASAASGRDLMVHCAQEMNHLGARLAALHSRFGHE